MIMALDQGHPVNLVIVTGVSATQIHCVKGDLLRTQVEKKGKSMDLHMDFG